MSSLSFVPRLGQLVLPIGLLTDCIGSILCRFVQITMAALSLGVSWPCHVQKLASHSTPLHPLALTFDSLSLLQCSLSLKRLGIDVPFRAEHLMVMYS